MTHSRLEHLDSATIAALVDRTLDPAARAAAEAHLAACADCREVWVETSEMAEEMREAGSAPAPATIATHRSQSRRPWMYTAAGLAAAAIGMAIWLGVRQGDVPTLELMVQVTGGKRFTEARTSVAMPWQPRPSPVRAGGSAPSGNADAVARVLEQDALRGNDAIRLHEAGLAALMAGRPDDAVRLLEGAASAVQAPEPALDLSAALLEKCRTACSISEKQRALDLTDRVLAGDRDSALALFNRALALEALGRTDEARRAWQSALFRQGDQGWRDEVAGRLERLRSSDHR